MIKLTTSEILALDKFDPSDLPTEVVSAFGKLMNNYLEQMVAQSYAELREWLAKPAGDEVES
jgi:hypothetical protein